MKRIKISLTIIFLIICVNNIAYTEDTNNPLSIDGLWILNDVKEMCNFLGVKKSVTYNYCLKINNEKYGYIYFIFLQEPIKVIIEKKTNNLYSINYKNKKRDFEIKVFSYSNDDLGLGFKDMCEKNKCFFSGSLETRDISEKSLKRILDWIKIQDSLPDAPETP